MQKYAAIDIGTNSMRLLLAKVENGKIVDRKKHINPTRIGSSVDKNKLISDEGITRNIEALYSFGQMAKEYGAEKIYAIATSAVRDAANGKDFIERAYERTEIKIDIISGEEEATLGYQGVAMGLSETQKPILVIDIGGGSTELILGQGPKLEKTISLNIGAVRMTERWVNTDPISNEEHKKMEQDIYEIIKDSAKTEGRFICLGEANKTDETSPCLVVGKTQAIGIGGTITTLAALHQQLDPYDPDKVHNYKLTLEDIAILKEKLLGLTVEEIKNLKGIHPKRADIITAGTTILHTLMNNLGIKEITVSEYDNLEGLLCKAT